MELKSRTIITLEAFNIKFISKINNSKFAIIMWVNHSDILAYVSKMEIYDLLMMKKSYLDLIYNKKLYTVSTDNSTKDSLFSYKTTLSSETEKLLKNQQFESKYCDDLENVIKFKNEFRKIKIQNILTPSDKR